MSANDRHGDDFEVGIVAAFKDAMVALQSDCTRRWCQENCDLLGTLPSRLADWVFIHRANLEGWLNGKKLFPSPRNLAMIQVVFDELARRPENASKALKPLAEYLPPPQSMTLRGYQKAMEYAQQQDPYLRDQSRGGGIDDEDILCLHHMTRGSRLWARATLEARRNPSALWRAAGEVTLDVALRLGRRPGRIREPEHLRDLLSRWGEAWDKVSVVIDPGHRRGPAAP